MSNPKSAKFGRGTWNGVAIDDVANIRVASNAGIKTYGSSKTNGQTGRVAGLQDKTGSFDMHADEAPFDEGDVGTLILKSDANVELFSGTAIIEDISINANINTGDIISLTVSFGAAPNLTV